MSSPSCGRRRGGTRRDFSDLVGELSTQSELFRTKWAAHNVRNHDTGVKRFLHPVAGELMLTYDRMELAADSGLTPFVYTADPGSKSEEALNLLSKLDQVFEKAAVALALWSHIQAG